MKKENKKNRSINKANTKIHVTNFHIFGADGQQR